MFHESSPVYILSHASLGAVTHSTVNSLQCRRILGGRKLVVYIPRGEGVLSYKRLLGMCRRMGSHFHDWSDYDGVAFSIELLEWGRKFSDIWSK